MTGQIPHFHNLLLNYSVVALILLSIQNSAIDPYLNFTSSFLPLAGFHFSRFLQFMSRGV